MKSSGGCRNVTMNWKQNKEKQVKPKMFEKNNHSLEKNWARKPKIIIKCPNSLSHHFLFISCQFLMNIN
jgi:hypothetical protein